MQALAFEFRRFGGNDVLKFLSGPFLICYYVLRSAILRLTLLQRGCEHQLRKYTQGFS